MAGYDSPISPNECSAVISTNSTMKLSTHWRAKARVVPRAMARARPSAALTANSVSVRYCSISSVFMCSPESHCGQEPPLSFAALCGVARATAFAWDCRGLRALAHRGHRAQLPLHQGFGLGLTRSSSDSRPGAGGRPTRTSISAAGTTASAAPETRPRLRKVLMRSCQDAIGSSSVAVISSSFFVASFCGLKRRAVMLFCQFCICRICFSGSFEKVSGRRGPRLAASNFLNPRRPPSTAIVPISATIAQPSDKKTDWEPCARSVLFCSVSQ